MNFSNLKSNFIQYLMIAPSLSLYFIIVEKIINCNKSEGLSMYPTIQDQSLLLIDKFMYKYNGLKKNDIIIAQSPVNPNIDVCKRILYLENEQVNGIIVPKNHVWIEGDNKQSSFDSRNHGPIPICLIKGKVYLSLCPFQPLSNPQ